MVSYKETIIELILHTLFKYSVFIYDEKANKVLEAKPVHEGWFPCFNYPDSNAKCNKNEFAGFVDYHEHHHHEYHHHHQKHHHDHHHRQHHKPY